MVKNPHVMDSQEMQVQSVGRDDPLEKELATHSGILAWRIPWTQEPGGLQSIALQSWTLQKRLSLQAAVHKCPLFSTPSPVVLSLIFILPILIGVQ